MKTAALAFITASALLQAAADSESIGTTGIASWYGESHRGRIMANGKRFDPDRLTCACWDHPLGAKLLVSRGRKSVVVTVTERGPAKHLGRAIDLSAAAFRRLADLRVGLVKVRIQPLRPEPQRHQQPKAKGRLLTRSGCVSSTAILSLALSQQSR